MKTKSESFNEKINTDRQCQRYNSLILVPLCVALLIYGAEGVVKDGVVLLAVFLLTQSHD